MNILIFILTLILTFDVFAKNNNVIGEMPSIQDCGGLIAVLPTFHSKEMASWYEKNQYLGGKILVDKIQSLAEAGDKELQFTYGMLFLSGYCVPQDICTGWKYIKKSRGGQQTWEKMYPYPKGLNQKTLEEKCS